MEPLPSELQPLSPADNPFEPQNTVVNLNQQPFHHAPEPVELAPLSKPLGRDVVEPMRNQRANEECPGSSCGPTADDYILRRHGIATTKADLQIDIRISGTTAKGSYAAQRALVLQARGLTHARPVFGATAEQLIATVRAGRLPGVAIAVGAGTQVIGNINFPALTHSVVPEEFFEMNEVDYIRYHDPEGFPGLGEGENRIPPEPYGRIKEVRLRDFIDGFERAGGVGVVARAKEEVPKGLLRVTADSRSDALHVLSNTQLVAVDPLQDTREPQRLTNAMLSLWNQALHENQPLLVQIAIADLPAGELGEASITRLDAAGRPAEGSIILDTNADGHGWFVDPTAATSY
jgi:hypothetical protein